MPRDTDIMSALTNLFLGLQTNMRQSKKDQLEGLALMSKMPGAELTPAPDAEAAPWWQALMGVPAFRNGPGGMPVASVAGAPVTVRQYGRAENQAALTEMLTGLRGTSTATSDLAPAGSIVETDNLAPAGSAAAPLTPTNLQARTARFGTTARAFGVTPDEFAGDYEVQRLLRTPGRQDEAFGKRYREMAKEKRERLSEEQKLTAAMPETMTKNMELIARVFAPVKPGDEAGYQRGRAMLRNRIDPALFAELPATYDPVRVPEIVQRGLTYAQSTETERALDRERQIGKIKTAEDARREQILGPIKSTEELVQFEAKERLKQQYEREGLDWKGNRYTSKDQDETILKVRNQLNSEPLYKTFATAKTAFSNLATGMQAGNGFGDLTMVYGMAALNDPNPSVVHASEFDTAEKAQGWLQAFFGTKEKFFEGDRLTPLARQKVLENGTRIYRERSTNFQEELRPVYGRALQNAGLTFSDVVPELALTIRQGQGTAPLLSGPMTEQEIQLNMLESNKQRQAQGKPPATRAQIIDGLRKLGYQVP